jgi:hypothetical protein
MADSEQDKQRLQKEVHNLVDVAGNFSGRFINDARVRGQYMSTIRQYASQILNDVKQHRQSARQGAERAVAVRNEILAASRLKSTDLGRAWAEKLKKKGRTLDELMEYYARKRFGKAFAELATDAQRDAVYVDIIEGSGRWNPKATADVAKWSRLGKGLMFMTIGIAIYDIATAEDKVDATKREVFDLGTSTLGTIAGGAAMGLVCGPGAPLCAGIGVFVMGLAGGIGGDFLYEWSKH